MTFQLRIERVDEVRGRGILAGGRYLGDFPAIGQAITISAPDGRRTDSVIVAIETLRHPMRPPRMDERVRIGVSPAEVAALVVGALIGG